MIAHHYLGDFERMQTASVAAFNERFLVGALVTLLPADAAGQKSIVGTASVAFAQGRDVVVWIEGQEAPVNINRVKELKL